MRTRTALHRGGLALAGIVAVLLTGCSASQHVPAPTADPAAGAPGRTSYPVTLINCGVQVTFTKAPERAVAVGPEVMELLVGISVHQDVAATWGVEAEATRHVPESALARPVLQDELYPAVSQEALLAGRFDAIIANYDVEFTADESGLRRHWAARGVPMFTPEGGCSDKDKADYSLATLVADVRKLGVIFDRQPEAERLATDLQARVGAVAGRSSGRPVEVFIYDSEEAAPYTYGGLIAGEALTAAGGRDVFADLGGGFHQVSWEQVATRNPEAIMIVDHSNGRTDDGAKKMQFLKNFPVLAGTRAMQNDRFLVINLASFGPSLTLVDDLERMVIFLDEVRAAR